MKNMWSSQIYQDICETHKHTCLQLQVSGSIWGAGDDGPIFFTVLPLLHPRHQDTGLKQMQQIKSHVLSSCCVCSGEDTERKRESAAILPVASPKWNSAWKLRHAACFLNSSRWEASNAPVFAERAGRGRGKAMLSQLSPQNRLLKLSGC